MNFNSNIHPNLIEGTIKESILKTNPGTTQISPPITDVVSESLIYIYKNYLKNNLLWIIFLIVICVILYYRYKKQEKFKVPYSKLVTFNPLTGKAKNLLGEQINYNPVYINQQNDIPVVSYNDKKAHQTISEITGTSNPYEGAKINTNYTNIYGLPNDYITTSSVFNDYATTANKNTFLTYNALLNETNKDFGNIKYGPEALISESIHIDPPYVD